MLSKVWKKYGEEHASKSKAYSRFYNAMKTDSTVSTYTYNMKRFMDFLTSHKEIKTNQDYDLLLEWNSEKITDVLEEFVATLNKNLKKTSSVKTMLAAPELFLEMNRKIWHKKLVRRGIKKDGQIKSGKLPATDEDIQRMLEVTKNLRDIAVIHFLASTGARPAGIVDPTLKMKHLTEMPQKCYAVKIYDQYDEGYWAFLTPEARKALDRYFSWRKMIRHEEFDDETPIFSNHSRNAKNKHMSEMGLRKIIEKALKKAGIERLRVGTKYDKATITMFRKRFNGKLKQENQVNSNIAEKLMAHKKGLDGTYLQPTKEECFVEFVKAIPELTVSNEERQKLRIKKQEEEISEYHIQQNQIDKLKQEVRRIQLRSNIVEEIKQGFIEWSEKNPDKIHPIQIAKTNIGNGKGIDEIVEHFLLEHDGNIDGLRERFANARITILE